MMNANRLNLEAFLVSQLYSATTSISRRILIGSIITHITRLVGVELRLEYRVLGFKRLKLATFELMKIYKVESGQVFRIYLGNRFIPLS